MLYVKYLYKFNQKILRIYEGEKCINYLLSALFLLLFLVVSCETPQNSNQNNASNSVNSNQNSSTAEKTKETTERHIKIKSENSFDETYSRLKKSIEEKEPLTIIAELDHAANAKKAGMELRPTKVIMFGNPKLGTPLMKANQEIGVDLPQKMLVYEDEKGDVYVVYNDPKILAENHKISGQDEVISNISNALKGLAENAAKKP